MAGITLRNLAERLGVSTATISMVLNNKPGISEETRMRVLEQVKAAGYHVRRSPERQKKAKDDVVLLIYKKHGKVVADTPFFSRLIESIENKADQEGYRLSIRYLNKGSELSDLDRGQPGGLLLLATEMDEEDLRPFLHLELPLVVLDNEFPRLPINTVSIDNAGGTASAVKHLIDCGHTRIGYMKSSVTIRNFTQRFSEYENSLQQYGLQPGDIVALESNMDGSYRNMASWLSHHDVTSTAFVADNDFIALGAIRALREKGLIVDRDISVVGFDDLPFVKINEPPLTTVRVYNDVMGAVAFSRLTEIIRDPSTPYSHMQIGTVLKVRRSVQTLK